METTQTIAAIPVVPNGAEELSPETEATLAWLEGALPRILHRLKDSEDLDTPLLQLPLAQLRLAQALYNAAEDSSASAGETMGHLSERLGVRQNALTQAADRLINHELAERIGDPQDRRIVRLRLTAKGYELVRARRARRRAYLRRFWSALTPEEHDALLQAVRTLEEVTGRVNTLTADEKAEETIVVPDPTHASARETPLSRPTPAIVTEEKARNTSRAKVRQNSLSRTHTDIERTTITVDKEGF